MKKISAVCLLFCAIITVSCGKDSSNEDETTKLGGSCSIPGEKSCSINGSEILICKDSLWHTKEICDINFGEYCHQDTNGSYICSESENNNDGNELDNDNANSLPDNNNSEYNDSDTSNENDDSDDLPNDDIDTDNSDNDSDFATDDDADTSSENELEIGDSRETDCIGLPTNATWNTATSITQYWNGSDWTPNEMGQYDETPSTNKCVYKCNEEFFWNNSACINPCSPNPCTSIANSTGICSGINSIDYSCSCKSGYVWNGSKCEKNPCYLNPCLGLTNSTEICTVIDSNNYLCSCKSGYDWWGSEAGCSNKFSLGNICTNQNKCSNNSSEITCPSSPTADFYGQDAQYATKGKCISQSFQTKIISEEKIVTDLNSGLIWQQTIPNEKNTWEDANNYCNNLNYGSYSGWRLPTVQELLTIVDNNKNTPPLINSTYFPNTPKAAFWSLTAYTPNIESVWVVNFNNYVTHTAYKVEKAYTRCVKGNKLPISSIFTTFEINGDEIVTDNLTKLTYQKTSVSKTWQDALKYCEDLTYAGYTDWRLPNKNELASLINYEKYDPASNFPDMPEKSFWTSSTCIDNTDFDFAWLISFESGYMTSSLKSNVRYVRCVR